MPKFATVAVAAILFSVAAASSAQAGCFRVGETGYHWYRWCVGPHWLYPHHRVCRHGHCWYR